MSRAPRGQPLGRALAQLLRHDPARYGVQLDAAGWADLDAVAAAIHQDGAPIGRATLLSVIAEDSKGRFVLSPEGGRVRAAQGHSLPVDLGLRPALPPELLWHGTLLALLPRLVCEGLRPMRRQHVHLSSDLETAERVARRRAGPIALLEVQAGRMQREGLPLYRAENGVWLADAVPPRFLRALATPSSAASPG